MAISSTDMSDQFTLIARNYEGKAARDRTVRASVATRSRHVVTMAHSNPA